MSYQEDPLSFLNEITPDKLDEIYNDEKLEIATQNFISNFINYFSIYLQKYCELPPINKEILDKFVHIILPKFINIVLPNQDVLLYGKSLLEIGSICYFFIKINREICFFEMLSNLILQYKEFIPKDHLNFHNIESILQYYKNNSVFYFATSNSNINQIAKSEIANEKNIQFRPNKNIYTVNSSFAYALYISGIFIEIRKYLSDINFFNDDPNNDDCFTKSLFILSFLKGCFPFMSNEYISYFASDIKHNLQTLDINFSSSKSTFLSKFKSKNALIYSRTLREIADLSDEDSYFFNELYFNTINNLIKIDDEEIYNSAISELMTIPHLPFYTKYFIQNLAKSFMNDLIYSIKDKDIQVIISISGILNSKEMLPPPKELFEKCSGNNLLYSSFFSYIHDFFNDSSIDQLFESENKEDQNIQTVSIRESTGNLIVRLLDSGKYNKSTKLNLIFRCIFNLFLSHHLFEDFLIRFSEKDDFKEPIFQALSSIIIENSESDKFPFDLSFICKILNNLNSTLNLSDKSKDSDISLSLISENLIYELDSILIPRYFNKYNFLPISDVELFWDLSVHSPLFYRLIQPNCIEIKDILFNSSEFSIGLSNCLLTIFEKVKDIKFLCRAAIIAYSLNDSIATYPTPEELNHNENDIKEDTLLNLIRKIKFTFNNTMKDSDMFDKLIEIIENTDEEYINQLTQFLSEVDIFSNVDQNSDFLKILASNDISLLENYSDDKIAMLIAILMITNDNEEIEKFVTNSIILKLFDSFSVFAKTIITRFISTRKINNDAIDIELINSVFFENSQLGNFNICKNLINCVNVSQNDEFLYFSVPEIIEMVFKEKIPMQNTIWNFLSLLQNCQTYQQYETSFLCLLNREPRSENLSPFLFNIIISEQLPSCLRNGKIIHQVMNRIAENPVKFLDYISNMNRIEYTEFRPQTNNLFLHVLAQFNDFIFDLINTKVDKQFSCHELAYLLANLKFTSVPKIPSNEFTISKLDDLYEYIPFNLMKYFRITYVNNNRMIEDTCLPLNVEKSISYSLSKMSINHTIIKCSQILFIHFEQSPNPSQIIIDDLINLSEFSSKEVRYTYKLSSIISEKNNIYIYDPNHLNSQLEKESGYICYTPNKSYFTNSILEQIKFVVYKQEDQNDDFSLWISLTNNLNSQRINKLPNTNKYLNSINYDMGCVFMEVLNNPHIDWTSFKQNCPNFIDLAITLIHRLYIRPLFDTFCDDSEFSEYLFTKRYNILRDTNFTDAFQDEIVRTAKSFPNKGLLICILCDDIMNYNQYVYFNLLKSVNFSYDCQLYAISQMSPMYTELGFTMYFESFVKSPEITNDNLRELLKSNKGLLASVFIISDPSLIDLIDGPISIELLKEAVKHANPSFLAELLKKLPDDSELPEKIRILSKKLYNNKQYQSLVLNKIQTQNENERLSLSIESISHLLLSTNEEFLNAIFNEMVHLYPPEKAAQYHIPKTIIDLLIFTKRFEDYYPLVELYRTSFLGNPEITFLFTRYLFSHRPSSVKDYDKMANLTLRLSQIQFPKFIEAMKGNFPRTQNDIYRVMINYSGSDVEQVYELFFKLIGKCRFLRLFRQNYFQLEILLQACYSSIANKNHFIKILEPIFNENLDSAYISLLLIYMQPFPSLFAFYYEKLISYKCVKETYIFSMFIYFVSKLINAYYDRKLFYTTDDHIDEIITRILQITNDFIETNIMQVNYNPRAEYVVNYTDCICSLDISLNPIKILQHDARLELFRFYRNIAFTIPNFILTLMCMFTSDIKNLYNFLQDDVEKTACAQLTCELFRECIGDRQIIPSINTQNFAIVGSFLNVQFFKCLCCKSLNYKIIRPFLQLLKALLRLDPYNPLKNTTISYLVQNTFIYNLFTKLSVSNKILYLETSEDGQSIVHNDEFIELQEFFSILIDHAKIPTDPNFSILQPNEMILAIKQLRKEDEMFNYRVLLFHFVIQKLPERIRKNIILQTYDFIDDLASDSTNDDDAIQQLLILYLENYQAD